jgi:phosphoribosylaminoimidazole-succinocarboxamide synthase
MAIGFRSLLSRSTLSSRRRKVISGTSKTLFEGMEAGTYVLQFRDQICPLFRPAYDLFGKGAINNRLSELFLSRLNEIGVSTHFIKRLNMSEQLVRATETLPFRVTVHNVAVDHLVERLGLEEHHVFSQPIIEFSHRSRDLSYPVVSDQHIVALQWAHADEVDDIMTIAQRVNDFLNGQFFALGLRLLNFTLEFGRSYEEDLYGDSPLMIIDEISPDTCAILDLRTGERLDGLCQSNHDRENLIGFYQEVARRFGILEDGGAIDLREPFIIIEELKIDEQQDPGRSEGEKPVQIKPSQDPESERIKRRTTMTMNTQDIKNIIEQAIPHAIADVRDPAADGKHYTATVTSEAFRGKTRIQQHQMVYQALGELIEGPLHALAITTKLPE